MGLPTFKGGIHPYEGKELSEDKPVTVLESKGEMVFPISQHIGSPAIPLVAPGDRVLTGQKIGEMDGIISSCVISSVSGTVKSVEPRVIAGGSPIMSVVVENDQKYETTENFGTERDPGTLSKEEIRNLIKEAGVVGLGGAGFPTYVKLSPKDDAAIDTVIVNGAECEPYLTSDYRMMIENTQEIVKGLHIVLQLFENARGIIGIEQNKPEAIRRLQELVVDEPRITIVPVKTKYPQGWEKTLIYSVTGRKVKADMIPAEAGCIVDNVGTMVSIYQAVAKGIPLIWRTITVSGDAILNPGNYYVRTGTNYQELADAAGGFKEKPQKLISGGPMMGQALSDLNIPVTKVSSALLGFIEDEKAVQETTACIRCGRCVHVCPGKLVPQQMVIAGRNGDMNRFFKLNGMDCCECGCCSYVCPAKIPLTETFIQVHRNVSVAGKEKV